MTTRRDIYRGTGIISLVVVLIAATAFTTALITADSSTGDDATIAGVADTIGCSTPEADPDGAPGATEFATCQLDGSTIRLYQFADHDDATTVLQVSEAFGIGEDHFMWHGNVLIGVDEPAAREQIRDALA